MISCGFIVFLPLLPFSAGITPAVEYTTTEKNAPGFFQIFPDKLVHYNFSRWQLLRLLDIPAMLFCYF